MGGAAVAIFGEQCKVDDLVDEYGLAEACRLAQVPKGDARTINGSVELAELVHGKYGYYHDVSMIRNSGQVAFNIYGGWLGQSNFPYTEEQYLQKLQSIVRILDSLDQAWYIKNFLLSPITPRRGLPATPRADTAVTLRLNMSPTWKDSDQQIFDLWYSTGGNYFER